MPCFDGLFPQPCEKVILDLLFILGTWHALAKLRMHSTFSLRIFEGVTKPLGQIIRRFHDHVCSKYWTQETPSESAKRLRRASARESEATAPSIKHRTKRQFNLRTYKLRALGHYPAMIRCYGTTDSYNTQTVWWSMSFINITSFLMQ
jgi:hypothetical protein